PSKTAIGDGDLGGMLGRGEVAHLEGFTVAEIGDLRAGGRNGELAEKGVERRELAAGFLDEVELDKANGAGEGLVAFDGHGRIVRRVPGDGGEDVPGKGASAAAADRADGGNFVEQFWLDCLIEEDHRLAVCEPDSLIGLDDGAVVVQAGDVDLPAVALKQIRDLAFQSVASGT